MPTPTSRSFGLQRQLDIYLQGASGVPPEVPVAYGDLREVARARLRPEAYDYVDGGAGAGGTMRANRAALDRWRIVPKMLTGACTPRWGIELFGEHHPYPVLLAPVGVQGILHAEGEVATARGAATHGIATILSTVSSRPLEEVALAAGATPRWFQLYWSRNPELVVSFLERAREAGFSALVVTLDTTQIGWRERDLQHGYLPFFFGDGLANYFTDPVFRAALAAPPEEDPRAAIEYFASVFSKVDMTWEDLASLRSHWSGPIVLKGIQHPDDARRALDHGIDGVIVSNHGGRQLDGAIGSAAALPGVAHAVAGRVPVLFDSGIRHGSDIVKVLALGADAALIGRPFAYGLAAAGEAGVRSVLHNLLAEMDLTAALSGRSSVDEIAPDLLEDAGA